MRPRDHEMPFLTMNHGSPRCSLSAWFGVPSACAAVPQHSHPSWRESGFYLCPPGPFLALLRRPALPWTWWHPVSLMPPPVTAFSPSQTAVPPARSPRRAGRGTGKPTLHGHPPLHVLPLAPPAVTRGVAVGTLLAPRCGSPAGSLAAGARRDGTGWTGRSTQCWQTCPSASASGMLSTAVAPACSALAGWRWRGCLAANAGENQWDSTVGPLFCAVGVPPPLIAVSQVESRGRWQSSAFSCA